jgi:hypothetical protein
MVVRAIPHLPALYETDETAWLETMSDLLAAQRFDELDYPHLEEYLADMVRRDRREVESRLALLIAHVLKWEQQPDKRSGSWRATIEVQRQELRRLLRSGTLRNHALAVLAETYPDGVRQAVAETEMPAARFPRECPYTLEQLLSEELLEA